MINYTIQFKPSNYDNRDKIRKIMLAVSILLDFSAIALIVSAIIMPLFWIAVVLVALLSNAIRYIVNIYPKKYSYGLIENYFQITEISPLRSKNLYVGNIQNLRNIELFDFNDKNKINKDNQILLCDNSCMNDIYMLKFSDKNIILPLDEYLYTLLRSNIEA